MCPLWNSRLDSSHWTALNADVGKVGKNHYWKIWVGKEDPAVLHVLEEGAEALKQAWSWDEEYPKSYPQNTSYALFEIRQRLKGKVNKNKNRRRRLLPVPSPPKSLFDLIHEGTVEIVYEEQNGGSYRDALKKAVSFDGPPVWRKIWRAIDAAYAIGHFGDYAAPKPKVQFLHRRLLEMLRSEALKGMTPEGILGFLDDMCPCGKTHKPDAIRKLRKRHAGRRNR